MKQKINLEDLTVGLVLFVIGLVLFISSVNLPSGNELTKGADFMPKIVSGMLAVLGICFTITAFLKSDGKVQKSSTINKTEAIRFLISFALFFVYIFFLKFVGFFIMTALYIMVQSWFITPKDKRHPALLVIISISVSAITYALFVYGLKMMLPAGILG